MGTKLVSASPMILLALVLSACGGGGSETTNVAAANADNASQVSITTQEPVAAEQNTAPTVTPAPTTALAANPTPSPVPAAADTPASDAAPASGTTTVPYTYSELPGQFFSAQMDCAYGTPVGPASPHTVTFDSGTLTMTANSGSSRDATAYGVYWRIYHASSTSYSAGANGENVHKLWLALDNNEQLIGAGLNGDTDAQTVWCGESISHSTIPTFFLNDGGFDWRSGWIPLNCEIYYQHDDHAEEIHVPAWLDTRIDWGSTVLWEVDDATIIKGPLTRLAQQIYTHTTLTTGRILRGKIGPDPDPYGHRRYNAPEYQPHQLSNTCGNGRCKFTVLESNNHERSITIDEATMSLISVRSFTKNRGLAVANQQPIFDLSCAPQ